MSITDSALPKMDNNDIKQPYHLETVSLNEIFKECMKEVQSQFEVNIIVRCQSLPDIQGNKQELSCLFHTLMTMIVGHSNASSRLFLYVDCEEEIFSGSDSLETNKNFIIRFHSNISITEDWEKLNEEALEKCNNILSYHNGNFKVNLNSGCLFSLTFPGKLQ
jgi:hypothetical protein